MEQHLMLRIGAMVIEQAKLAAELDAMREKVPPAAQPTVPEAP
jgi:hypothetical protein